MPLPTIETAYDQVVQPSPVYRLNTSVVLDTCMTYYGAYQQLDHPTQTRGLWDLSTENEYYQVTILQKQAVTVLQMYENARAGERLGVGVQKQGDGRGITHVSGECVRACVYGGGRPASSLGNGVLTPAVVVEGIDAAVT